MVNIGRIPEKWAALTPRGDAVVDTTTERRTTWAELDERVRRLANGLRGPGPTAWRCSAATAWPCSPRTRPSSRRSTTRPAARGSSSSR